MRSPHLVSPRQLPLWHPPRHPRSCSRNAHLPDRRPAAHGPGWGAYRRSRHRGDAGLDLRNRVHLHNLVATRGVRIILTTHDLEFARIAERALVGEDRRIACDAASAEAVETYRRMIKSETPGAGNPTVPTKARASVWRPSTKPVAPAASEAPPRRRGGGTPVSDRARSSSARSRPPADGCMWCRLE